MQTRKSHEQEVEKFFREETVKALEDTSGCPRRLRKSYMDAQERLEAAKKEAERLGKTLEEVLEAW